MEENYWGCHSPRHDALHAGQPVSSLSNTQRSRQPRDSSCRTVTQRRPLSELESSEDVVLSSSLSAETLEFVVALVPLVDLVPFVVPVPLVSLVDLVPFVVLLSPVVLVSPVLSSSSSSKKGSIIMI